MSRVLNATVVLLALAISPAAQEQNAPVRFTAFAVSTGGPRTPSGTADIEIIIERWSTPEQTQKLIETLKEQGPEKLLNALRDLDPVGRIRTPGNVGYDLRYAHQVPTPDGGRRVFIATDRPISFWEARNQARVMDYPFTFIELRLNAKGEGEGKLALATQVNVSPDGKVIELVNYDAQPVQLNQVRQRAS